MKKNLFIGLLGFTLFLGVTGYFIVKNNNFNSYQENQELSEEHTLTVGFLKADSSDIYLSDNPLPLYKNEDVYYDISLKNPREFVYTNTMQPIMVRGTLDIDNNIINDAEVMALDDTHWNNSKYLRAYTYLLDTGAIQAIQKYTSLAIGLINFPNDTVMQEEFNNIESLNIDFMKLLEIDDTDDLIVSLAINCDNLFNKKDLQAAESITNQTKELISKLETFDK